MSILVAVHSTSALASLILRAARRLRKQGSATLGVVLKALLLGTLALGTGSVSLAQVTTTPPIHTKTTLSQVYEVDRKYKSMKGPSSRQQIVLGEGTSPELMWITGTRAVMVGPDGETPAEQEFMFHSNLDVDPHARQLRAFESSQGFNPRIFTLSQGQFDIQFPPGFGIPVLSDEALSLTTQGLNHNMENPQFEVRHKITVEYVRDRDAGSMIPLFSVGVYGLALMQGKDGYFGIENPSREEHGASCLPGETASDQLYHDPMGRTFTGHWVVKPGREVKHTLVTELLKLPYNTTVHYIAVHLHPFAESLELRDLTTGKSLFKSTARNFEDKIGLPFVASYSDPEGFELYKDHQYQLVSVYNNTSGEDQDSMAVMYLYLRDKTFDERSVKREPALQGVGGQ